MTDRQAIAGGDVRTHSLLKITRCTRPSLTLNLAVTRLSLLLKAMCAEGAQPPISPEHLLNSQPTDPLYFHLQRVLVF